MLILLPPSEGKFAPRRGKSLDLAALDFTELSEARRDMMTALLGLCAATLDPPTPLVDEDAVHRAATTLGLGSTQAGEVHLNGRLATSPTARADRIYTGVLYDALDLATLTGPARRRATSWLAITSSLFGLVRPNDAIPSYRLAGNVTLPDIGGVAAHWRKHLDPVVTAAAGRGLIVDLRSSTYAAFWKPNPEQAKRVAQVRVLQQVGTQRKVVSHFNKATKGRLVRAMLLDGSNPTSPAALADHIASLGWKVELASEAKTGTQLDVIVDEL